MLIFLHGEDMFLVGRRRRLFQQAFLKKYPGADCLLFDFEDRGTAADVSRALSACAPGLFAAEKMVVFLHATALEDKAEEMLKKFLKEELQTLPEHTLLLFVETGKIKKTQPLTKLLLAKQDKEEVCDVPDEQALRTLVRKELTAMNEAVQFVPQALESFLRVAGSDTARVFSELEKITTYKDEGIITEEDVAALLAVPEEDVLFQALDVLSSGAKEEALLLFRRQAATSDDVFRILSLCVWQVRRLLILREAWEKGVRQVADLARATKQPPFAIQKTLRSLERLTLPRLKHALTQLSDIDAALKQGKTDPAVALDLFVWKF